MSNNLISRERKLRRKAKAAGFAIKKGFQHWLVTGAIWKYPDGTRETGYLVVDLATNSWVPGSYNSIVDHAWTLDNVEEFLKDFYTTNGLKW